MLIKKKNQIVLLKQQFPKGKRGLNHKIQNKKTNL